MAFFTFTTVSGSAATNDLVYSVANAVAGKVTLSLSATGTLVYTNVQGNSTDSGYTLANLAQGGQPVATTGNVSNLTVSLATFQTPGLTNKAAGNFVNIDASAATAAQINAFIANSAGAATYSLQNANLTPAQFVSLNTATLLQKLTGVDTLDATGATAAQVQAIVTAAQVTAANNVFQAASIDNLTVTGTQFNTLYNSVPANAALVDAALTINASDIAVGTDVNTLMGHVITDEAKVDSVTSLKFDVNNIEAVNLAAFLPNVAPQGITSTVGTDFTALDWNTVVANRTLFAPNSITAAGANSALTVANFLTIPNKFAANGVTGLTLVGATTAQIDLVAANAVKIADHVVTAGTVSLAQFQLLANKIADTTAVVDATGATAAQTTSILQHLHDFAANGLSNLTLTDTQFNNVKNEANAGPAQEATWLNSAVGTNTLTINAAGPALINASTYSYTAKMNIAGSEYADNITTGVAANTVQGGKGSDIITATGATGQVLRGGNGADTITGGSGADTIYGGKSTAANVLTGGGGADTFITSEASLNTITDLQATNIITNVAGAVTNAVLKAGAASFTATSATTNNGVATITGDSTTGAKVVDLTAAGGTVGWTINGGAAVANNTFTGSAFADSITGGAGASTLYGGLGNDSINGGAGTASVYGGYGNDYIVAATGASILRGEGGANTIVAGAATDTILVNGTADTATGGAGTDTITNVGGSDSLTVHAGGIASVSVASTWTAAGANEAGLVNITVADGHMVGASLTRVDVDLSGTTVATALTDGYSVTAAGNTYATSITGSAANDLITGGNGNDTITGGQGADAINGGAGADVFVQHLGDSVAATTASYSSTIALNNTITFGGNVDVITGFAIGTDKVGTYTGNTVTCLNGATTATALTAHNNYYITGDYNATTHVFTVNATSGHDVMVIADANGYAINDVAAGHTQTGVVIVTGVPALTASDFVVHA